MEELLPRSCRLCPRACGADRAAGERGVCGADDALVVARSALHAWEEPPISGRRGSGAIFFSNCPLRCVYCQNASIAAGHAGRSIDVARLAAICLELQGQGALNVNFVTPSHYAPHIRAAVDAARRQGLGLPVVWNTSGYETVEATRSNAGYVDVYLTDFKYADGALGRRYSKAPDYPQVALAALEAMAEQAGEPVFDEVDGQPRMLRGVVVRHLLLPGCLEDSKRVVRMVHERFGSSVLLSLMNQYTPVLAQTARGTGAAAADVAAADATVAGATAEALAGSAGGGGEHGAAAARAAAEAQAGGRRGGEAAALAAAEAQLVLARCPELASRVPDEDYERLLDYADSLGVDDYFWQEGGAAQESFIPAFDLTGV